MRLPALRAPAKRAEHERGGYQAPDEACRWTGERASARAGTKARPPANAQGTRASQAAAAQTASAAAIPSAGRRVCRLQNEKYEADRHRGGPLDPRRSRQRAHRVVLARVRRCLARVGHQRRGGGERFHGAGACGRRRRRRRRQARVAGGGRRGRPSSAAASSSTALARALGSVPSVPSEIALPGGNAASSQRAAQRSGTGPAPAPPES